MNDADFGKAMENKILSYRYQACTNRRKKELFSEPNHYTANIFSRKSVNNRDEKNTDSY